MQWREESIRSTERARVDVGIGDRGGGEILRENLRDPVLRARGQAWLAVLSDAIEERLSDDPRGVDSGLGDLILAQWQGALTVWGFRRRGSIATQVRRSLGDLLDRLGITRG